MTPLIAVLDYGIGNLRSAQKALQKVGADAHLTADPALVGDADAVVLPGVGAFGACMAAMAETGLDEIAADAASSGKPFLGICVGMQMMFERSEESPDSKGLGLFEGTVERLPDSVKRPQMQWNRLEVTVADPLLGGLGDDPWVYFVHSYAVPGDQADVIAVCDYGGLHGAAFRRDSLWAVQFHPEKSAKVGLAILSNFVRLAGG